VLQRRAIPVLLAAATLVPIGALAWLGTRILQQDRDVERQRRRESLEVAAGRLALAIDGRLSDIEEQLARGSGIRLTANGLEAPRGSALLYGPANIPVEAVTAAVFASADALEFQRQDLAAAAAAYRALAESPKPAIRAAALNRLGRVLRKAGDAPEALQAYARLLELGAVPVEGQPAALLARQARCRVYEQAADAAALRKEAADLAAGLSSSGWRIDRPTFELYRDMLQQWGAPPPPSVAVARTEAAIALWRTWRTNDLAPRGRRILRAPGAPVLAVWTGGPDHPAAWLATPAELEASLAPLWHAQQLAVSLSDIDGQPVLGAQPPGAVALNPAQTRLPFLLNAAIAASVTDNRYRMRRTLLISGLLATFAFMIAAGFGLYRITTREMELVRQQSDFVSGVSHEFRTPLTSMRHLTELLASNSVPSESRKAQYYDLLSRETERLHRMVESLLSFGSIEAGAYAWHLEPVKPSEFVTRVVEEFRQEPQASGRELLCEIEQDLPPIQADREALSRALWNLLENAGKYSEPSSAIRVFAQRSDRSVLLGVEDHGSGITPAEQGRIFQKFMRGAEAKRAGVRGVGVGLALVKRIAEAHGGSVRLDSQPGRGSTFILELPCHGS
jgi:signal transduction histidine kinase